jgi:hypothetical protein
MREAPGELGLCWSLRLGFVTAAALFSSTSCLCRIRAIFRRRVCCGPCTIVSPNPDTGLTVAERAYNATGSVPSVDFFRRFARPIGMTPLSPGPGVAGDCLGARGGRVRRDTRRAVAVGNETRHPGRRSISPPTPASFLAIRYQPENADAFDRGCPRRSRTELFLGISNAI